MIERATFNEIAERFKPAPSEPVRIVEGATERRWFTYGDRGCIGILPLNRERTRFRVGGWFVVPEWRGKQIGTYLLRHVMLQAARCGATLEIRTKSTAPLICGWTPTGKTFKYGGGEYVWVPPTVTALGD